MDSSFGVVTFGNVMLGVVCAFHFPLIICSLAQCDGSTETAGYHVPVCGICGATTPPRFCLHGHITATLRPLAQNWLLCLSKACVWRHGTGGGGMYM